MESTRLRVVDAGPEVNAELEGHDDEVGAEGV